MRRGVLKLGQGVAQETYRIPWMAFEGQDPSAPRVHIQASVHGSEVQGNAVIWWLIEHFHREPPLGSVTLIPQANPVALAQKLGHYTQGRFNPLDGENWNRHYWKVTGDDHHQVDVQAFAERMVNAPETEIRTRFKASLARALEAKRVESEAWGLPLHRALCLLLQSFMVKADIVLDLHTESRADYHVYVPDYARESGRYLGLQHGLIMNNLFQGAADEAGFCPWWDLSEALDSLGRTWPSIPFESFTVELRSQEELDWARAEDESRTLLNYLRYRGVVAGDVQEPPAQQCCWVEDFRTLHAPYAGFYQFTKSPGSWVEEGEELAKVLGFLDRGQVVVGQDALKRVHAPARGIFLAQFASPGVPQGAPLGRIMTEVESW